MLQIVLLAGKFAFLVILYLFIFWVVRSTTRELRASAPAPSRQAWTVGGGAQAAPAGTAGGGPDASAPVSGTWSLVVEKSLVLPVGGVFTFPPGGHALAGRSPEMDIHLEDTFVSSKHALFELTDKGLQVEDLLSTNGTQVNGADIGGARLLRPGDRVEIGDTVFRVEVR
jgi:hypothetical protein